MPAYYSHKDQGIQWVRVLLLLQGNCPHFRLVNVQSRMIMSAKLMPMQMDCDCDYGLLWEK